jgi:hypothetical protein
MECIAKKESGTMLEDLFQLQFKATGYPNRFIPRFETALKTQRYYDQGLAHLRTQNPDLSFITPSYYLSRAQEIREEQFSQEDTKLLHNP